MAKYYVNYYTNGEKHAGPYTSLDSARKKAISMFMKGEVTGGVLHISKDSTKGLYGYVIDYRDNHLAYGDWVFCTANQRRAWAITPDGKINYIL